ncbi:MAG TPA: hypothetical protein PK567_03225 [Bacillota bacterium]|nr:hypothetical protein [Bacillota bacterium]
MKTVIGYMTKTKHSETIAKAVAQAVGLEAVNMENKPTMYGVDLLILVSGIYAKQSMPELLEYARTWKSANFQKVALITSSSSAEQRPKLLLQILKEKYIEIVGECRVKGNFLLISRGHPNEKDINTAIEFAQKVIAENDTVE